MREAPAAVLPPRRMSGRTLSRRRTQARARCPETLGQMVHVDLRRRMLRWHSGKFAALALPITRLRQDIAT